MDIIGYDIIKSKKLILVFLKIEERSANIGKLSYNSLNNIIYKLSNGYCVSDRRGRPLTVRENLKLCEEFLNEEYNKKFIVHQHLILDVDVPQT